MPIVFFSTTALAWEEDVHLTDVCGISKAAVGARFVVATWRSASRNGRILAGEMVDWTRKSLPYGPVVPS